MLSQQIGDKLKTKNIAYQLYLANYMLGDIDKALEMHVLYSLNKDSLINIETNKKLIEKEYEFMYVNKITKDSLLYLKQTAENHNKIAEQNEQLRKERQLKYSLYVGVFLLFILSSFLYFGFRQKAKANDIINRQKEELEAQNDEIERQHINLIEINNKVKELNNTLEIRVNSRTQELLELIEQLRYYHNDLAHNVRAPLATLMGLVNLIQDHRFDSKENEKVLRLLRINTSKIDTVIRGISQNMTEFDEYWEEKMRDKKEDENSEMG